MRFDWSALTRHPIRFVSVVVCMLVCVVGSYQMGVFYVHHSFQSRLDELRRLEDQLRVNISICTAKTGDYSCGHMHNELAREMAQAVTKLEADWQHQKEICLSLDLQRGDCRAQEAGLHKKAEKHINSALVRLEAAKLTCDIDALQTSIETVHSEESSLVLLRQKLQQLRHLYTDYCSSTPGCVELTDTELMERWGNLANSEDTTSASVELDGGARGIVKRTFQGH